MKKLIAIFVLLTALPSFSQMTPQWVNVFGRTDYSGAWPEQIVTDSIGNIYVLDIVTNFNTQENTCHDPHLRKINSSGITEWKINFGTYPCAEEGAFDLKIFQNNLYVFYSKRDSTENAANHLYASKVTLNGNIVWTKILQKNFEGYYNETNAAIDKNGTSYIASIFSKSVKRITSEGHTLDSIKVFADGSQCSNINVDVDIHGRILINSFNQSGNVIYNKFLTLCDSLGAIIWTKFIAGIAIYPLSSKILFGSDNCFYEYSRTLLNNTYTIIINKFSAQGDIIWTKEFASAQPITVTPDEPKLQNSFDGNLILAYTAFSGGATVKKLNSISGDAMWSYNLLTIISISTFTDLAQDKNGSIYLLSQTLFPNYWQNGNSYTIVKLSPDGTLLRKTFNDSLLHKTLYPSFISLTSNNDIVISGIYMLYPNDYEQTVTIKYSQPVNISSNNNVIPEKFSLLRCYPNPFNPNTVISFQLPHQEFVNLNVNDVNGRVVSNLVNEKLNAGEYKINFNGSGLTSGIYFYKLTAGEFSETKKMILVK